jgi:hypothetical protein
MNLTAVPTPLTFFHILDLHTVYGYDTYGPKIRFSIVNELFITDNNGIYIITLGREKNIAYCGMCGARSFRNSLLFTNSNDLHFHNQDRIRNEVGQAILGSNSVEVHGQTEEMLRQQLLAMGKHPSELGSLRAIKKVLIKLFGPKW